MNYIIIVTGERDWRDRETIYRALDEELQGWMAQSPIGTSAGEKHLKLFTLRHGVAEGADWIANDWARERGVTVERFPAQWKDPVSGQYDSGAGPRRNRDMAKKDPKADKVCAFWSGKMRVKFGKTEYSGTLDMIKAALTESIPVSITPPRKEPT